jgi:aminoglycoside phosphotransferase (APT) family kinase protein
MVRQHGDFYSNNLGLHGDALVVFDWEDFGLACLPGYDLALLLLSLNAFNPSGIRSNTVEDAPHSWILRAGTQGTGLTTCLFFQLMPAYLAITAKIKRGRGYDVKLVEWAIRAMTDALRQVDGEYKAENNTVSGQQQ